MLEALFVDIGGVLLTNGWDHTSRDLACTTFGLEPKEFNSRHALAFDPLECGKITLQDYLNLVVFYTERSFSQQQFIDFMFAQSQELSGEQSGMIEMLVAFKQKHKLKVAAVSNEGRDLTEYRIKKFNLNRLFDFYVSSCFVHLRKPDPEIYNLAVDLVQVPPKNIICIDDRAIFIQVAQSQGIPGIIHKTLATTQQTLESLITPS